MKKQKKQSEQKKQVTVDDRKSLNYEEQCEYVVIPPDGGWGWMVVTVSFFTCSIIDGAVFSMGIFLEEIVKSLNTSATMVSLSNSILCGIYLLFGPIVCATTNRMGFRWTSMIGALLGCTGMLGASFANKFFWFCLCHGFCCGLSFSILSLCSILSVGFYFEKWRPLATAITVSGTSFGTVVLPLIFKIPLEKYDWRFKFRIISGCLAVISVLMLVHRPIKPVKVTLEDTKKSTTSVMVNDENPKSTFYKKHNTTYPTHADLTSQSAYSVELPKYVKAGLVDTSLPSTSTSKSSMKSYKIWYPKHSAASFYSERMGVIPEEEPRNNNLEKRNCKCSCIQCYKGCCRCRLQPYRPMYKDDILFTGSVNVLPEQYRSKLMERVSSLDYHLSVTRISSMKDKEESHKCCICCPESVKRTLATMMDFSLLKRFSFLILVLSGFFTYLGLYVPYAYSIDYAKASGMNKLLLDWIIPCIGLANLFGRVGTGLLCFVPNIDALRITEIAFIFSGIATAAMVYFSNKYHIFTCLAVFGFTIACISSLRPIIAVEMVGLENLTNAYGLIVLFEGISSLIALPLASLINENTKSFKTSFTLAGMSILLSSLILFPIKKIAKWEKKKKEEKEKAEKQRKLEEARKKFDMVKNPKIVIK